MQKQKKKLSTSKFQIKRNILYFVFIQNDKILINFQYLQAQFQQLRDDRVMGVRKGKPWHPLDFHSLSLKPSKSQELFHF